MQAHHFLHPRRATLLSALCLLPCLTAGSAQAAVATQPGPQLIDEPLHIGDPEWRYNFSMARAADGRAIIAWSEDARLKLQRISSTGQPSGTVTSRL